jgi:hypothetical protein
MDTDCVIDTVPYPAESLTTISPSVFVTPSAAVNERHGSAIEQLLAVLASAPSDATNVLCADANAAPPPVESARPNKAVVTTGRTASGMREVRMTVSLVGPAAPPVHDQEW